MNRLYCPNCLTVDYNLVPSRNAVICACRGEITSKSLVTYADKKEVIRVFKLKDQPGKIPTKYEMYHSKGELIFAGLS